MNRTLVTLALFFFGGSPAFTQTPEVSLSSMALQSCLLGTGPGTWEQLQLNSDQLRRMQFVQEACKEECDLASAQKRAPSHSTADGSVIMEEVRNILTGDQYRAWTAYCAGNTPAER